MSSYHPSAMSAPLPGGNTAKTCHHCNPPLEFEKVGQKKAHYRVTHQSQTTITSPDNLVQIKCTRQPDGVFHCPRGECEFTTPDPTSLSGHSSTSCTQPWPPVVPTPTAPPPPGAPPQYFQVTSTAAALGQYAAAAGAHQQQLLDGHAPPLFPAPANAGDAASGTQPFEMSPSAGLTVAPPVRPKRYFCRRCYPHLHFSSEIDKKQHIDKYHDGRARDRVFPSAAPTPPGEGKRKERSEGLDNGGGTPDGSVNGDVKPAKKRSKLEHHVLPSGASATGDSDAGREGTPQHGAYGGASLYTSSQHELDQQRAQFSSALPFAGYGVNGSPYAAGSQSATQYQQQQQQPVLGLPSMSSMMPPPPHPVRHHSHSSGTMPPPPAPPSGSGSVPVAARRKSRAAPEKVVVPLEFPCMFCIVEPACDFATREELDAHVAEAHDWRAAERQAREARERLDEVADEAERVNHDEVGWCDMCVPRIAFGNAAARDWHWKVAHQRLKGPPPAPPTPPPELISEATVVDEAVPPVDSEEASSSAPAQEAAASLPVLQPSAPIAPSPLHDSLAPPPSPPAPASAVTSPALASDSQAVRSTISPLPSTGAPMPSPSSEQRKPRMSDLLNPTVLAAPPTPTTPSPVPLLSPSPSVASTSAAPDPLPQTQDVVSPSQATSTAATSSAPAAVAPTDDNIQPQPAPVINDAPLPADDGASRVSVQVI